MNVLEPELILIDGRRYRIYETAILANRNVSSYTEDKYEPHSENDETTVTDIEIECCSKTKYKHAFHVAPAYFPHIVGANSSVVKRVGAETKTCIQIPRVGQNGDIIITGLSREAIISARNRIDLIVESSRCKIKPTHFLSIPLNDSSITTTYEVFKDEVLYAHGRTRGIDKDIFQETKKLHLTIGVLVLLDDKERNIAIETLKRCKEEIVDPVLKHHGSLKIQLKGLECMNDDPSEVKVLYAQVVDNELLQNLVDTIAEYFRQTGLMKNEKYERDGVKLHVTLMNTWFKMRGDEERDRRKRVNLTFDAKNVLTHYKDTDFGEMYLKEIHLSQFHTVGADGYYIPSAKIDLN